MRVGAVTAGQTLQGGKLALLTPREMGDADRAAKGSGIGGFGLMEAAGSAVAVAVGARWPMRPVTVLCGPGNNGGDGFVAARHLAAAGWPVKLALLGSREKLSGEAAQAASLWTGPLAPFSSDSLEGAGVVIDAIFGAGLLRPLDGGALAMVEALKIRRIPVCAVDVPSGLDGASGTILGAAAPAEMTVTFFRKKPCHLLYPGRGLCGDVELADIGIPATVLDDAAPEHLGKRPGPVVGRLPLAPGRKLQIQAW
jgi:ADP-dependent NAD(P)H-hydrate dehydratase / NAD(P)H-hydrate epimerase